MAIENGTYIFANADIKGIQAKKERISPLKNTFVDYGSDSDLGELINPKQRVLKVYGDLDQDNGFEEITFPATKLIGKATGKSVTIKGQLYYEVVIDADFGILKRTRHFNFLGVEKAGTYEKYSTEGWFLDSDIENTVEQAEAKYTAVKEALPSKTTASNLALTTASTAGTTRNILISAGVIISLFLIVLFTRKEK